MLSSDTRHSQISLCPCGSKKKFQQCCYPYLSGQQYPKTPEKLMRSRYSAFMLGGYGQYLQDTWAKEHSSHLSVIELSKKSTDWVSLEIINKSQQGDKGMVEFKAAFKEPDSEALSVHHEVSQFERRSAKWVYVAGDIMS